MNIKETKESLESICDNIARYDTTQIEYYDDIEIVAERIFKDHEAELLAKDKKIADLLEAHKELVDKVYRLEGAVRHMERLK